MDIYALNSSRRREHVVDRFESFIWTERFATYGDFEIHLRSTQAFRDIFNEGRWIVQNGSYRVMVVDTVEDTEDEQGKDGLKVVGRSLEAVLEQRIAAYGVEQLRRNDKWAVEGTPGDILRFIFLKICIEGLLDTRDTIPDVTMDAFPYMPKGSIPEPQNSIKLDLELKSIYEVYVDICTTYNIGFCLLLNPVDQMLHFQVITGTNRTSAQSEVDPIVFSPEMDNLVKPSELTSSSNYKNVAVVVSEYGMLEVYANGASHQAKGFDRRVLLVKASVKADDPNKEAIMQQAGLEELAKHRRVMAFDGEVTQRGHRYAVDYFMGDITEMRKHSGVANYMRVSEQIFVDDAEGERTYPALSLEAYIAAGSWYGYPNNDAWYDVDPDTTWHDLPG